MASGILSGAGRHYCGAVGLGAVRMRRSGTDAVFVVSVSFTFVRIIEMAVGGDGDRTQCRLWSSDFFADLSTGRVKCDRSTVCAFVTVDRW